MNSKSTALGVVPPLLAAIVYAVLSLMLFTDAEGSALELMAGTGALAVAVASAGITVARSRGRQANLPDPPWARDLWVALSLLGLAGGQAHLGDWRWLAIGFALLAAIWFARAMTQRRGSRPN